MTPDGIVVTSGLRKLLVAGVLLAMVTGLLALGISLYGASVAASNSHIAAANSQALRMLLLDGKTASAKDAKRTAKEVSTLLSLQAFDHQQTQAGTRVIAKAIMTIETNIDATIQRDVNLAFKGS